MAKYSLRNFVSDIEDFLEDGKNKVIKNFTPPTPPPPDRNIVKQQVAHQGINPKFQPPQPAPKPFPINVPQAWRSVSQLPQQVASIPSAINYKLNVEPTLPPPVNNDPPLPNIDTTKSITTPEMGSILYKIMDRAGNFQKGVNNALDYYAKTSGEYDRQAIKNDPSNLIDTGRRDLKGKPIYKLKDEAQMKITDSLATKGMPISVGSIGNGKDFTKAIIKETLGEELFKKPEIIKAFKETVEALPSEQMKTFFVNQYQKAITNKDYRGALTVISSKLPSNLRDQLMALVLQADDAGVGMIKTLNNQQGKIQLAKTTQKASNLDSILAHYREFPKSVDMDAVKASFKSDPKALKAIEQVQKEAKELAARNSLFARQEAQIASKFSSAKTTGDIRRIQQELDAFRGKLTNVRPNTNTAQLGEKISQRSNVSTMPSKMSDVKPDTRGGNQMLIEEAVNRGDIKKAIRLINELPDNNPYKTQKTFYENIPHKIPFTEEIDGFFKKIAIDQRGGGNLNAKVEVPQIFKTEKFNLDDKGVKTLNKLQESLGLKTRGVRSFEDMQAVADELGADPKKLLKEIQSGRITDSEVIALSNQINTSTDRVAKLFNQLKNLDDADPLKRKLQEQLFAEENLLNESIKKQIRGGTEGGRAIAAFRVIANKTLDPNYWLNQAQRQIGAENRLKPEEISAIKDLVTQKDKLGLANFISGLGESTLREKMIGLWKAGLLTGFRTHEANMISNTGMGALETIKDIPATAFDMLASLKTGKRAVALNTDSLKSMPSGLARGFKQSAQYLTEGVDPRDLQKAEFTKKLRFGDTWGGKAAQKFTNTIFGSLGAEDKIFRETAFNRAAVERANVARINGQISDDVYKAFIKDPNQLANNPALKAIQEGALEDALQATFNKDNALATGVRSFKAAGGPVVAGVTDVIAPFVRTPANVAESMIDYSPVGFAKDVLKGVLKKGSVDQRRLSQSFGRSTVGSGIIALGYMMAKDGLITGASSNKETVRSQKTLENEGTNSVLIDGQWRKIDRVSPYGNLLILGSELFKNGGDIGKTAMSATKSLVEQNFLKGVSGALQALSNPEQSASNWIDTTVSSTIPTILSDVARGLDDVDRMADDLPSKVVKRIPGLRQELPSKPNALGEDIKVEGGFLGNLFDPFQSKTPNDDPLVNEFKRVGYNLNYVDEKLSGEKLEPEVWRQYQRKAGTYIKEAVPKMISTETYQNADTETQRDLIEKVVNRAKAKARNEMKKDMKEEKISNKQSSLFGVDEASASEETIIDNTYDNGGDLVETSTPSITTRESGIKDIDYLDDNGNFKVIKLSQEPVSPELTGLEDLDKKLVSNYSSSLSSYGNKIIKAYQLGKLDKETAQKKIEEINAIKEGLKNKGGGRARQGSRVKQGIRITASKAPTVKMSLSRRKTPTVKIKGLRGATKKPSNKNYQRMFTIKA